MTVEIREGGYFYLGGWSADTKFRVIKDYNSLRAGDIVKLEYDDGTSAPKFENARGDTEYMSLPTADLPELKVYEEVCEEPPTLNVGEPGSPRYEALRLMLAVLDGDRVAYGPSPDFSEEYAIDKAASIFNDAISFIIYGRGYVLESEYLVKQKEEADEENLSKIKELEATIAEASKQVEELKNNMNK